MGGDFSRENHRIRILRARPRLIAICSQISADALAECVGTVDSDQWFN